MALTPIHGLPYPEPTSDARLGAGDIEALAEAIDARLAGALFVADVGLEAIPNATNDLLNLTLDDTQTSGGIFVNSGALHIKYVGIPTVVATLYGQVTWQGSGAGTRRMRFLKNGVSQATSRQTPDADPLTVTMAWPMSLATDDIVSLEVWQNSGGSLDVTGASFRCVIGGIAPA